MINRKLLLFCRWQFLLCILLCSTAACNESGDQQGSSPHNDTNPGVVTTPLHDTSSVVTPPPTNDSNVVSPDSLGTSR